MEIEDNMQNRIIETKETIAKSNETKTWFFEKINKIEKNFLLFIKKKIEDSNQ